MGGLSSKDRNPEIIAENQCRRLCGEEVIDFGKKFLPL